MKSSRIHTVRRLEMPDGWATHKTGCGIPLVKHDAATFTRAPISAGDIILTEEAGLGGATCLRCSPSF